MRKFWGYVAIGAVILGAYVAQSVFHFSNTQLVLAYVVIAVIWLNYQVNTLKEAKPTFQKKRLDDLFHSKPIEVKHNPPKNLTPDGKQQWGAEDHDFEFFRWFWFFGQAVNNAYDHEYGGPWRLQELPNTEISGSMAMESPAYGRRYEIFYNQVKLGLLEIVAGTERHFDKQDRSVNAEVKLDGVPITALHYSQVRGFLYHLAGLLTSTSKRPYDGPKTEYEEARGTIDFELMDALWDTARDFTLSDQLSFWGEFTVSFSGTPDHYYQMEAHERAQRLQARAAQTATRSA